MSAPCIIGIDPGASGGIAWIDRGDCAAAPMPRAGSAIDWAAVAEILRGGSESPFGAVAYVEKVHSMPQQGVASTFRFGQNVGGIHGVLGALGIPMQLVTPQAWKKRVLAGTTKDKAAAIAFCRQRYPSVSLLATERSRKPHDGMADALCLAHYGLLETSTARSSA